MYAPEGMDHFDSFEASEKSPVFACVKGHQVSKVVTTVQQTESSGWGETFAQEVTSSQREFVITGVDDPYEWDDEGTITAQEYKTALQNREVTVAEIKARQEEYNASRAQTQNANVLPFGGSSGAGANGFNF
jgi:hypothetical protein